MLLNLFNLCLSFNESGTVSFVILGKCITIVNPSAVYYIHLTIDCKKRFYAINFPSRCNVKHVFRKFSETLQRAGRFQRIFRRAAACRTFSENFPRRGSVQDVFRNFSETLQRAGINLKR